MNQVYKQKIKIKTPLHLLEAECLAGFADLDEVKCDKKKFSQMCRDGCKNFDKKYSCPPFAPDFSTIAKEYDRLFVVMLTIDTTQNRLKDYPQYHRLRICNAVLKPRIERLMLSLEEQHGGRFLSSGSCRLCKPCKRIKNQPCSHPDRMRPSLEACGVDCNALCEKLFGIKLEWYKNKKCPKHTAVVCGLLVKKSFNAACELLKRF